MKVKIWKEREREEDGPNVRKIESKKEENRKKEKLLKQKENDSENEKEKRIKRIIFILWIR